MAGKRRILVVGGYGAFGLRASERLAREADLDIVVAGRSLQRAREAVEDLAPSAVARLSAAAIDATRPDAAALAALAPTVVINASGPFQAQDFALARAAIEIGAHYIDLADASRFVLAFARDRELDTAARAQGRLVVTGASTVPAISAAVIEHAVPAFETLTEVRYGISPGNNFDPGPATTASVLGAVGAPFKAMRDGGWQTIHGWQGLSRHRYPTLGRRWMGYCDIPDLTLFPERWPSLRTVDFRAGVEVTPFHLGLWLLSWPARWRWLSRLERLAPALLALKRRLAFLGSDAGGMFMELSGNALNGAPKSLSWHLEALRGHGPYIPTTPAVILARRLARGEVSATGARACIGLVTLAEIERELSDLDIRFTTT